MPERPQEMGSLWRRRPRVLTRVVRRLLRRDRHVWTRLPGPEDPAVFYAYLPHGARAGDQWTFEEHDDA